ncbi:MAG: hypothetical protein NZ992_00575, partial [Candidatus Korarchaeum sp.]|nr:hypothetical protein [Candidatus Korarchaeum sp.]MDW8035238.1 hypothetical protein [Candidatus Korarchaeum sp.]
MKEALVILASLMIASFTVFVLQSGTQLEYYEYKGELRTHQLYVELESIEPRAMVYARSQVDAFLASANGSSCVVEPPNPDPNIFRDILSEDLAYKGFRSSISLRFTVSETQDKGTSNQIFGSYCRKGGISVRVSGGVSIEDVMIGIRGNRDVQSIGCQQTAYYT